MENEMLNLLKTRRSIRKYKPDQISEEDLNAILEAGTFAPTGMGAQSPVIIAVQDPELIAKLSKMNAAVAGTDSDPYYGAPTVLIVLADRNRATYIEDGSCVLCCLLNAAHALGLGSCWIHRERQMFSSAEGEQLLAQWGLSRDYVGIGACALGFIDGEPPVPAPRKDNYVIHIK